MTEPSKLTTINLLVTELIMEKQRALHLEEWFPGGNQDASEDLMKQSREQVTQLRKIREILESLA